MHILLTNDDGIFAPGLAAAYKQLCRLGRVTVVAPSEASSGASHSVSLAPLTCRKVDISDQFIGYSVEGTPADCVNLAVLELLDEKIDLVAAGVNLGANVGIHVHYSGTVAAAMEGAFCGLPSVAISAAFEENIDIGSAAEYGVDTLAKLLPLAAGDVININIPKLSAGKPKGVRVVPHSTSGFHQDYSVSKDAHGAAVYEYAGGKHRDIDGADTDTTLLEEGFITVTSLHFDMTDYEKNRTIEKIDW